jgi:two-component system chemotaxis sensor kinase CheA
MFGFDRVASFTHDFETAFDLIRKGKIAAGKEIVTLSLEAKDHIRQLIEDPISTSEATGQRIVASLQQLLAGSGAAGAPHNSLAAAAPAEVAAGPAKHEGWRIRIAFAPEVMRNGANPLALLDDLRGHGPCKITVVQIWRDHVRMTVEADKSVKILRGELTDRQDRFTDEEQIRKQAGYET